MKRVVFIALLGALMACNSTDKKVADKPAVTNPGDTTAVAGTDPASLTSIQWLDSTYLDLGKQKEGKEIELTFRFKNSGNKQLVIKNVSAQCGCTIPETPKQPFAPGEEGVIKAKFSGNGEGETRKSIYVMANTNPDTDTLTFRTFLEK